MTEKTSVSQEQVPQTPQADEPQLPKPHQIKNRATLVQHKRRRSHRKEVREWITAIVQLAGVVAVVISLVGVIVNIQQFNQQQQATDRSALDQRRQATLDNYVDQMSTLLLQYNLAHAKQGDPVQAVAQARTYTALRNIDPERQGTLIRFLWGANLITGPVPIIRLVLVNIEKADLSYAYLRTLNLSGALLTGANFHDSNLTDADLDNAHLNNTDLGSTYLVGANLTWTDLTGANISGIDTRLTEANLTHANLAGANLAGTDLTKVNLTNANLTSVNLAKADLTGANLTGAHLTGANLTRTNLTNVNLTGVNLKGVNLSSATLKGATMPDGSKHP